MRKFLISLLVVALQSVCFAGADSYNIKVADNAAGVTNSTTTSIGLSGYVESIHVNVTAPATQTVTVATADKTLLTATGVTSDTTYYPRYGVHDASGAAVGTITNQLTKHLIANEKITVTVTSTQTNVLDTIVGIKTRQ